MLGIVFSLFSVFLLVFTLYKKINAHMALLLSSLLSLVFIFRPFPHIVTKDSLNLGFFNIFQVFDQTMSSTLAELGLTLMTVLSFSSYMDHIRASYALFKVFEKSLKTVKFPYVLLIIAYFIVQFLVLCIPSHANSLIVCGKVFASSLLSVGFVDTLIEFCKNAGFGILAIITVSILLAVCTFLIGLESAAFFGFAPLILNIAKYFRVETTTIITPIQIITGFKDVLVLYYTSNLSGFSYSYACSGYCKCYYDLYLSLKRRKNELKN